MSRRPITRELYDSLLSGFREAPGNAAFAARRALCERRMAKRGWLVGWPQYPWAKPIKGVLENEAIDAQAAARKAQIDAQDAAEALREAARQEAIEAKKEEAQVLRVARRDVLAALVLANDLVLAMRGAVAAIKKDLEIKSDGTLPTIKPIEAMKLLTRHAALVQKSVQAASTVIELSRLERGESTINVALGIPEEHLSPEQIDDELAAIAQVLEASRPARAVQGAASPLLSAARAGSSR